MKYQITMSSGEKYFISESEAVNISKGDMKGLVLVPTIKGYINLSFVQSVIPEDKVDRSKMTHGRLTDGTRVIKKFGEWKDAVNPKLNLDAQCYPEVFTDDVMTDEEYETFVDKKSKLLKNPTKEMLECAKCKGTGFVDHTGVFTYDPSEKMCSCLRKELKSEVAIV